MAAPSTEGCVTDEFPLNPRSQLQTISPLGCGSGLNRLEENDGHDLSSHDVVGWIHRGSRRFDGLGLRLRRNDLSGQRDYEEDWRNLGGPTLVQLATERWNGVGGIYGGAYDGRVFVLTHRPSDKSEDPRINFVSDGIEEAVATAQTAAGDRDVGMFGASLSQRCPQAGLRDALVIHFAP